MTLNELMDIEDIVLICERHDYEMDAGEKSCPFCKEAKE